MDSNTKVRCSFCHTEEKDSNLFIQGDDCYICELCISKSYNILLSEKKESEASLIIKKPHEISCFRLKSFPVIYYFWVVFIKKM